MTQPAGTPYYTPPVCANCRRLLSTVATPIREVWNNGVGGQELTGRAWCKEDCRAMTFAVEGMPRPSITFQT